MLLGGAGWDLQFLMIVGKFNLKDMVLRNGVHSGITAMSERLKYVVDTILVNTQA